MRAATTVNDRLRMRISLESGDRGGCLLSWQSRGRTQASNPEFGQEWQEGFRATGRKVIMSAVPRRQLDARVPRQFFHRVGHPRDDPAGEPARRHQPRPGDARFRDARRSSRTPPAKAIQDGFNQYAITWGAAALRQAIAEKVQRFNGIAVRRRTSNVTVCCGATECMMATMLALVDPGDEVVIFQPFYENYGPDALLSGAKPVWVTLHPPDWHFDPDELRRAFSPRTKAIIVNTPNNPTGKVFTREELTVIAELCQEFDAYALADEIYEYIIYTDQPHVTIATLPGMAERTVTISGLSKTFSITGWRLGYCIAPPAVTAGIRKVHDFLTVGAPHPLQVAGGGRRWLSRRSTTTSSARTTAGGARS